MKKKILNYTLALSILAISAGSSSGQSPVEYMNLLSSNYEQLEKDTWQYTKAAMRGKGAKKIEKRRIELLGTLQQAAKTVAKQKAYEGDPSYRDATVKYLKLKYNILNEDFGKIVDMEAIAEQSYDNMEAYLLAKEKADEKLNQAFSTLVDEQQIFADTYDINLIEGSSKRSKKLNEASEVISYSNKVYLIFFKSNKQESYLLDAVKKGDVNSIVQNKNTLENFAADGIKALDTVRAFRGDASLSASCLGMLKFYQKEVQNKVPIITDFFLVKEKYEKIKASFEGKKQKDRTNADVNQYNTAIENYNKAVNKFNANNESLNKLRSQNIKSWNKSFEKFMATHAP